MKTSIKTLIASTALVAVAYGPANAQDVDCETLLGEMNASPALQNMNADLRAEYDRLTGEAIRADAQTCVIGLQEANEFAFQNTGEYLVEANSFQVAQADTGVAVEGGAAAAVGGGQLVVEQADPEVEVTVPEPTVSVTQAQPEVIVEQAEPEIVVSVPKPTVEVQQQAPIITVTQAEPTITVTIPEPTVTIRMPEPDVNVDQADPQVNVAQAEPTVRFIRPEPNIRIERGEADVSIAQRDPSVQIQETDTAAVAIRQADPNVQVNQAGEANIEVSRADAQVQIEEAGDPNVQVEQAEAQVQIEGQDMQADTMQADTTQAAQLTDENVRNAYVVAVQDTPFYNYDMEQLTSADVYSSTGENIGSVNDVVVNGQDVFAILEVGGFLGLGDDEVPVPLNQLQVNGDNIVVPFTEEQLEAMPEYDPATFQSIERRGTLADSIAAL